jgi:hypothetical protein
LEAQRRGIETLPCEVLIDTTPVQVFACKNCERPLIAGRRYCADCGQEAATPRLTLHEIGRQTLHALLHVDRSVLSLIRALALRPGRVALDYVSGRRKRYYGPFAFLIVTVALAAAAIAVTGFPAVMSDTPNAVARFLQHHVNLLFFVQVPIVAAACRALTPRGPFNYAEYLVLVAYTTGMHILFFTVVDIGGWYLLKPSERMARDVYLALMPVGPLYLGFACTQFLPGSKWLAAIKGVAASLISYAVTQGLVFAASNVAELFTRQ